MKICIEIQSSFIIQHKTQSITPLNQLSQSINTVHINSNKYIFNPTKSNMFFISPFSVYMVRVNYNRILTLFRIYAPSLRINSLSSGKNKLWVSLVLAANLVRALSMSLFCVAAFSRIASYSVTGCLYVCEKLKKESLKLPQEVNSGGITCTSLTVLSSL